MRSSISTAARLLALALALFAGVGSACAQNARPPAPDFTCKLWLNSKPLSLSELSGKVVLIDFWEYTCINCIRTFPYLRRWNQLYGPIGLVVIGVHTPEFDFARDPERVAQAVKRFGFTFPIAVDSDRQVWRAFHNDAWPSKYLIDKDGRIAMVHVGEGDYAEFELAIQRLLKEAKPQLDFSGAGFHPPPEDYASGKACRLPTPETYLGFAQGDRLVSPSGYVPFAPAVYKQPATLPPDGYALSGNWLAAPEYIEHTARASAPGDRLALDYRAKSVYLVAGSDDGSPKTLYVTQDGKPLPKEAHGVDIKSDANDRTYVSLAGKRMYYLVNNPRFGEHKLELEATEPALSLYSFTFGNECENPFDHR